MKTLAILERDLIKSTAVLEELYVELEKQREIYKIEQTKYRNLEDEVHRVKDITIRMRNGCEHMYVKKLDIMLRK